MNLRFVEAFYWAATLKSVSRAADKLFITQSAASARLSALEDELGVLLLDRRDKQFRLTVAGTRFLAYAEKLLHLQREIQSEMQGAQAPRALTLRLGVIESVLHSWLIAWIEALRQEQPTLELELSVETTPVLMELVRRGTLDLAFAAQPVGAEGVRHKALPPMPMAFVGPKTPRRARTHTLATLAQQELLTFQRGSQPYVALIDLLRQADIEPRRVHAISSISAMVQLVQGGFGVATLPVAAAQRLAPSLGLAVLRTDVALPPLPVYASYRHDPASTVIEQVLESALAFSQRESRAKTRQAPASA
ncbi:MAG: LysR family transcriptional regulator [Rhodoferax sp.]